MSTELGVSIIVPSNGSIVRHPLPSTGSRGLVPRLPRYYEMLRLLLAHPALLCGPRVGGTAVAEARRPPRFLENPLERALLYDPGGTALGSACSVKRDGAFRGSEGVGSHDSHISGLNHTARSFAVYASPAPSRTPTQDSLPAGRPGPWPGGVHTRRVLTKGFSSSIHRIPLSQA